MENGDLELREPAEVAERDSRGPVDELDAPTDEYPGVVVLEVVPHHGLLVASFLLCRIDSEHRQRI